MTFQWYVSKQVPVEMRPYVLGEDLTGVSVSQADREAGSPKPGDMIARNPRDNSDRWLVNAAWFRERYQPAPMTTRKPYPHGERDGW